MQSKLQIVVNDAVASGLPGVSLHVQSGDESVSVVAGVMNKETLEPVTSSSLFHAASVGKTFTATMILRLVDSGALQMDDIIERWLDPVMSAMVSNSNKITIKMLLAHTSGIPDYFGERSSFFMDFAESAGRIWGPTEILGYIESLKGNFEPGTEFSYSNTNTLLLGVIAERVTGMPLGMALRYWVFEPADLQNTFGVFESHGRTELARGYMPTNMFDENSLNVPLPTVGSDLDVSALLYSEGLGDAPIISTPRDLNSFIRTLIDIDTLLSEKLKAQMLTETTAGFGNGLGIFIDDGTNFRHSGGGWGLLSKMMYVTTEDLSFATTANGSFGIYAELYENYIERLMLVLEQHLES